MGAVAQDQEEGDPLQAPPHRARSGGAAPARRAGKMMPHGRVRGPAPELPVDEVGQPPEEEAERHAGRGQVAQTHHD